MAVKKLCGACGEDALERNPNCAACGNRHARWCRAGDPRGIPTPRKNVCAACGQPAHQTNPDCKTCIKREQRRAKAEGREPYIPHLSTRAMMAPPVPVNTLTTARDIHNHETLTGWLTARRNRLNPTPKKGNEMTTHHPHRRNHHRRTAAGTRPRTRQHPDRHRHPQGRSRQNRGDPQEPAQRQVHLRRRNPHHLPPPPIQREEIHQNLPGRRVPAVLPDRPQG